MITTSPEFQTKINAKARNLYARVTIDYTDVFLDPTIAATSTDVARVSYPQQAVNGRLDMTEKWFSFDQTFVFGDMYHLCPTGGNEEFNEFGWWSQSLSDALGNFSVPPLIEVTFSTRAVGGFTVAADNKRNEYPVDYVAKFYDGVTLLYTETVTGNTLVNEQRTFARVDNVDRYTLEVSKWSHPNRNVKIAEFTTQVKEVYTGESICDFNVIEEREISNDNSIPSGNISSSESNVCLVNNNNRQFDANNSTSRLFGLVRGNVFVLTEVGINTGTEIEFIPLHQGWATVWNVPENDLKATVSVQDRINVLSQTSVTTPQVQTGLTFYQWFEFVLNDGGVANTEYEIDTTFQGTDYIVPYGWFNNETHRKALEILAQGCSGVVYQDRFGKIIVKALNNFDVTLHKTYTRDDYMQKDNQPVYQNIVNDITVRTSPVEKTLGVTVYNTLATDPEDIAASTTETFQIYYEQSPISDQVVDVFPAVPGVTVISSTNYTWGTTARVQNTNPTPQQFQLRVVGSTYETKGGKTTNRTDTQSISDNGRQSFKYPNNRFLQNKNLAIAIAENLLASFKDPQRDLTISFSPGGNPSLELGDRIAVTDLYNTVEYSIVSTDMRFDGGLTIKHKGRI